MGKMNTLAGSYVGKVGRTYGARQYRQAIEKAVPFSHAPHNTAQTKAVRAFEKLNRFSAYVAKTFWRYLNLSDKKMYKHNAVANWLKPCVIGGSFKLGNIATVIPSNATLQIISCAFDFDEKKVTVSFENTPFSPYTTSEKLFVAVVADNGTVKNGACIDAVSQTLELPWDYTDFVSLSVVMFKSSVAFNKKHVNGFCYVSRTADFVIDGVLYTSRMPLNVKPSYEEGVIKFDISDAEMVDNILHFLNF